MGQQYDRINVLPHTKRDFILIHTDFVSNLDVLRKILSLSFTFDIVFMTFSFLKKIVSFNQRTSQNSLL